MHPDHFWVDDGDVARLRFRSVYVGEVREEGGGWVIRVGLRDVARVRAQAKAMRWLGAWASHNTIGRSPRRSREVPGF